MSKFIVKRHTPTAAKLLLIGSSKVGKTTTAACIENIVFIPLEPGLGSLQVATYPEPENFTTFLEMIGDIIHQKQFSAVAIDSMSALEVLIHEQVCADLSRTNQRGKQYSSIEDIPFGKGYIFALSYWQQFMQAIIALADVGIMPVMLAHTQVVKLTPPDSEPYSRIDIKLNQLARQLVCEHVDIIGYCEQKSVVVVDDLGFEKKIQRRVDTKRRVIHLTGQAAFCAGNRYGMADEIELSWPALKAEMMKSGVPVPGVIEKKESVKP
jgi:hypothetical protein